MSIKAQPTRLKRFIAQPKQELLLRFLKGQPDLSILAHRALWHVCRVMCAFTSLLHSPASKSVVC